MLVSCPSCQAKYNIDDARIPASGLKLKCPKCTTVFPVQGGAGGGGDVPLPGAGAPAGGGAPGAVPLPGNAPPAGPPPGAAAPPSGAVPLPGNAPPAGPPPGAAAPPSGGVPLPGGAPPAGPPPGAAAPPSGGVPLPGGAPPAGPPPGAAAPPSSGVPLPGGAPPAGPPPGAAAPPSSGVPLPGGAPPAGPPPGAAAPPSSGVPLPGGAPPAGPPPGAAAPPSSGVPLPGGAPPAGPPPGAAAPPFGGVPLPGAPAAGGADYGNVDLGDAPDSGATRVYAAPPSMPEFGNVDLGADDPAPAPDGGAGFDPFSGVDLPDPGAAPPAAPPVAAPPVPPPVAAPLPPQAPGSGFAFGDDGTDDLSFDPAAAPTPSAPPPGDDLSFDPTAAPAPDGGDLELDLGDAPAPAPAAPAGGGGDDLEILDFIDNEYQAAKDSGAKVREAGPEKYRVRRKSGKTFGPFEPEVVVTMLKEGQLLGNEEVSTDGNTWKPIGSVPQFAEAIQALMEAPSLGHDAPMMGALPEGADDLDDTDTVAPKGKGYGVYGMSAAVKSTTAARTAPSKVFLAKLKKRWPLVTAGVLLLGILGFGIYLGFTPYGYFAYKLVFTPGAGGHNKPTRELLSDARKGIADDTFAGYTQALESAKAALAANGDDVEAQSLYCQAAFYLQRLYEGHSVQVKRALGYMHDLSVTSKDYPPYLKAKMDEALLEGNEAAARPALVALVNKHPKDLEALYLLGASYFHARDAKHATAWIDKILVVDPTNAKAFHAEAFIHTMLKTPEARDTAIAYFQKALDANPQHLSSALELAHLYLVNDDPNLAKGEAALDRVAGDAFKTLSRSEQARADYLRGVLDSLKGQVAKAAKVFDQAVTLDPKSAFGRTAYGEFLLKRHQYESAANQLAAAVKLAPGSIRVAGLHVEALIRSGRALDATQALNALKGRAPANAQVIFLEGLLAHSKGDDDVAQGLYAKAMKADPHYYRAALALGNLFLEERRVKEAEAPMRAAVAGGPRIPRPTWAWVSTSSPPTGPPRPRPPSRTPSSSPATIPGPTWASPGPTPRWATTTRPRPSSARSARPPRTSRTSPSTMAAGCGSRASSSPPPTA